MLTGRPAYYVLKTLITKLDRFTSAEELAEGQYRFTVEGKAIYVLWGSGKIPEEIQERSWLPTFMARKQGPTARQSN